MKLSQYIKQPNLPENPVRLCAVSSEAVEIMSVLHDLRIQCIQVEPVDTLPSPVASHPDMQIHHLGENKIIVSKDNPKLSEQLACFGFSVVSVGGFCPKYPLDVQLNAARIGNICICNRKYVNDAIQGYCESNQINLLNVAQGYTKCSTCIINEKALITSDPSIYKAAICAGLDVLMISPGQIDMPGYDTGFLGGCTFKMNFQLLAFTGDISLHSDYLQIKSFLLKHHIDWVCLSAKKLFDIGGVLPLMEHINHESKVSFLEANYFAK